MALIAHYPLNGDTKDYSGYGRHGIATSVEWIDGKTGLSAKLDGNQTTKKVGSLQEKLKNKKDGQEWSM